MMDIQRLVSNGKISKLKNNLDKDIFKIYTNPLFYRNDFFAIIFRQGKSIEKCSSSKKTGFWKNAIFIIFFKNAPNRTP